MQTREEAKKFLCKEAQFLTIGHPPWLHGIKEFAFEYVGTEEDCNTLQGIFDLGSVYKLGNPYHGRHFCWNIAGEQAQNLAVEMKPLLQKGGIPAQGKAQYCI